MGRSPFAAFGTILVVALSTFAPSSYAFFSSTLITQTTKLFSSTSTYNKPIISSSTSLYVYYGDSPELDEFGLPVEKKDLKDRVPLKDQFYEAVDRSSELIDTILGKEDGGLSKQLLHEETEKILQRRRVGNKVINVKDKVLVSLDYVTHPGKAWKEFVADPIHEARERKKREKLEARRSLEEALQRYYAAKNRFYDTLDIITDTTRTTVKVAKRVGNAVVNTPNNVKQRVEDVKIAANKVSNVVTDVKNKAQGVVEVAHKIKDKIQNNKKAVTTDEKKGIDSSATDSKEPLSSSSSPPPTATGATAATSSTPTPKKVADLEDKIKDIWVDKPSSTTTSSTPKTPRLTFRQRVDAEEEEYRRRRQISLEKKT